MKPLGIVLLWASSLQASSIFVLTGFDAARTGVVTFNNGGTIEQGYAGVLLGTYDGVSVAPLFCVDLFTSIDFTAYVSTAQAPRLAFHEDRVAWLYLNQFSTVNSIDTGMAFQLAIWDIVHDNGDGLAAGSVQSSANSFIGLTQTQINLANAYVLVSLGHSVTTGVSIYTNADVNSGFPAQSVIGAVFPTPEPSSLGLGLLGLASLAFKLRQPKPSA